VDAINPTCEIKVKSMMIVRGGVMRCLYFWATTRVKKEKTNINERNDVW
jgi:hypothetical protein